MPTLKAIHICNSLKPSLHQKLQKSISFLLGAGFSVPKGYPTGNKLNELILKSNEDNFVLAPSGDLISTDGKKLNFGYKTSYDIKFCYELIKLFNKKKEYFDYEEFFDYITKEVDDDQDVIKIAKKLVKNNKTTVHSLKDLKDGLKNVYTKVVAHYLKDKDGNLYYDHLPYKIDESFCGYTGIMKSIKQFSKCNELHIHTLNHDLFFERFNNTVFIEGNLCDGFEELGSKYYGKLSKDDRNYMVRLQRYTGNYFGNFRLYKLHGSLDYQLYYRNENGKSFPERYLKLKYGIGNTDLFKEIKNKEGKLTYEKSWIKDQPDFLIGITSKIERYKESLLFKDLFKLFKDNLKNADKLIIIGYGAKDKELNKIILENFDYKKNKSYIIEPYAVKKVEEFAKSIEAKLIKKDLEKIKIEDFE